jgi:hypothetical protein
MTSDRISHTRNDMTTTLRRIYRALSGVVAEDRPGFKRLDVSPARGDDEPWFKPRQ